MTATPPASAPTLPAPKRGFWARRLLDPLRAQLTRGVSPDQLALTLGVGTACALFPFLGLTSLLTFAAGCALRLNHPILQTLNQLLGPVQLALILGYVRAGEYLWGVETSAFTLAEVLRVFRDESLGTFLRQFGQAGLHALTAWLLSVPFLVAAVTFGARPLLRRLARLRRP